MQKIATCWLRKANCDGLPIALSPSLWHHSVQLREFMRKFGRGVFRQILTCLTACQLAAQAPSFTPGAMLKGVRIEHTATKLLDGRVFVAGGGWEPQMDWGYSNTTGAEVYDPATGRFTPAGTVSRLGHTATLLPSGKVLLTGGHVGWAFISPVITATAEVYDPVTGSFQLVGNMTRERIHHTATLLKDGRVLIMGGSPGLLSGDCSFSVEIYDPANGTFSLLPGVHPRSCWHSTTLLPDGKVLIAGYGGAEVFDPATGASSLTGSPPVTRFWHTATSLKDGKVLFIGVDAAELYDPGLGAVLLTVNMPFRIYGHSTTLLPDGRVLIAGGDSQGASGLIFNTENGTFTPTANIIFARYGHTATMLDDGSVFIAGGAAWKGDCCGGMYFTHTSEIYRPGSASPSGAEGRISAYENPCFVFRGDTCTTYLYWKTSGASNVQVWVKINDGPETPFANNTSCDGLNCPAPWIVGYDGLVYTFSLYNCDAGSCTLEDHKGAQLLSAVEVTAYRP